MLEHFRLNFPSGQLSSRKEGPCPLQAALKATSSWFVLGLPWSLWALDWDLAILTVSTPILTGLEREA